MISIRLADEIVTVKKNSSLTELLQSQAQLGDQRTGFAVVLNRQFIPAMHYSTTLLQENDIVEMIIPMQGG